MKCRHCETTLTHILIDLGAAPPSNAYLTEKMLSEPEVWFPLKIMVCEQCWLVQTEDFVGAGEMFSDNYAYFSSYSDSWLTHANNYVDKMVSRFDLGPNSVVAEVAANDGYLLQYVQQRGIPCYGIEPTHSTAQAAREKQIDIIEEFFGVTLATELVEKGAQVDLVAANNVLAHVPDINDFVKGFSILLKPSGIATFEFPHLLHLIAANQFDTIYHEHYSYLSFTSVCTIFEANGLNIFDVEELATHGGSLRLYAQRGDGGVQLTQGSVAALKARERDLGVNRMAFYSDFQHRAERAKIDFLQFLVAAKLQGKKVAAYGAAAKGNTMLNYAGVRPDLLPYVVDKNPNKQGQYLPGSRIPIVAPDFLREDRPDYVIILPWNLMNELDHELAYIHEWGGKKVVYIPCLTIF